MIKCGRITGEVLWGWETQLFQTHSYQLLFFCREEKKKWLAPTPLRGRVTGMRWQRDCFFIASTQLGSCLLLNYCVSGFAGNVQSRRLLIHAASGFINATSTAEMMTPSNIPVHKPYFYYMVLIISLVAVAFSDCCDRGCLFVNRWKQHLAQSLSRPVQKGGLELVKKKSMSKTNHI